MRKIEAEMVSTSPDHDKGKKSVKKSIAPAAGFLQCKYHFPSFYHFRVLRR